MSTLTPSAEWRRTFYQPERKPRTGLEAHWNMVLGLTARRRGAGLRAEAERIREQAESLRVLDTPGLAHVLQQARARLRRAGDANRTAVAEALAALLEAAHRETGLRAYPAQLMGSLALQRGCFAEMSTGEGKTLVIGLAAALGAWSAPALHVITANDYLAARDADWLRPFFARCGLSVGAVTGEMEAPQRTEGYAADITYTTPKEVVADFLRDRLQLGPLAAGSRRLAHALAHGAAPVPLVMRGLHQAIIDEADYALIDEAVTPLIISREQENGPLQEASRMACKLARPLERGVHYVAEARQQYIELKPEGLRAIEQAVQELPGLWRGPERRLELLTQALVAREFFHRHRQYLVHEGKVVIIDEATGRVMPQRTWRQGLHQAIEAKEGLTVSPPTETLARLSFQKFFQRYPRLAGITGTGREAAGECWQVYGLPFVRIPTHRPCVRQQWADRIFATVEEKWSAIVAEVRRLHASGRPLLLGTRSVLASRHLAGLLEKEGLTFALLNAEHHREEAEIVADAGQRGRITIATNIAGRGTDIKLGPGVAELGGLHVIATERHESARVDRQLFGRAGRQGDPGSAQAFASLEDDLPRRYLPGALLATLRKVEGLGPAATAWVYREAILQSQRGAGRAARKQREAVLRADTWLEDSLGFAE